ncbi:sensor histidine kinase KdpD [Homoserinibacter sp. GY 40078]|uniref:sensor histidine kinase n=1 Tax=Homoserinibacter sp. GY 40078 TaxID=2603275 RepID=UPI0011C7F910|nr:HAMP domain-containing sensor histidine kinase [Homoserinibacter sp. GY 40078]TXK17654.1 HAMP domain-containing histidine kinase [Homoserinibacter sp. GY 40078]
MLPLSDLLIVVAISLVCSLVVGGLGLVVLWVARRSSMLVQVLVVVATSIVSVVAGITAVAQAMYVSVHDLTVVWWIAGVSAAVSIVVAAVLGHAFTRNSARLRSMARALGAGERLDAASAPARSAELAGLADELASTSLRLAQARDEVATLDASRRELVAWIAHDLRTPLAGLRAMAEALEDGLAADPPRFHRQMSAQVDHLSAMVDDLFELSKIQSGTLSLSMEPVSIYDLVSDVVAELGAVAEARSIRLREASSGELTVVGDPRELSRVIGNLLINAIQHSPAGSEITVSACHDGDGHVVLTVEDEGGGIPESDLSKIFQAGWRASPSRAPGERDGISGGAGLGLAIVHGIVEAHFGQISVQNVPGGCRFDVRLPAHASVAA